MKITKTKLKQLIREVLSEALPGDEKVPGAETKFGQSKMGGGEFRKASIATGKKGASGGFTNKERGLLGDLQKKLLTAAEAGDIASGKALQLARQLAKALDDIVARG